MDQKYFIISFTLLVFFFLTNVEKSLGCHPSGDDHHGHDGGHYPQITGASFKSGELTLTVHAWEGRTPPQAFGHFSFRADSGVAWRFLKHPQFVNGHHCEEDGPNEANPFTSSWPFDASQTPSNTWFDIWIAVYTDCYDMEFGSSAVGCKSYNLHYRGWQPAL
ncbi:hypothetical protein C1645_781768 [Glomus cerebriforme]|uniref:Reelin domain-containing protein n=1 Tax=Glomus cerebriforme TaxID=658196 RepID=A0A397SGV2_9GLOM|nr:hypothetical protein C1645_781768 [Glomus cerebriforme]